MRKIGRIGLLVLVFVFLVLSCGGTRAESLTVTPGFREAKGFSENPILMEVPFSGTMEIVLESGHTRWLKRTEPVTAGKMTVKWDGLGDHREVLPNGNYTLKVTLTGEDGETLFSEASVTVRGAGPGLRYALPSMDTLYTDGSEKWLMEYCLASNGYFIMEVRKDGETVYSRRRQAKEDECASISWDGKDAHGQTLDEGIYIVACRSETYPEDEICSVLTVKQSRTAEKTVGVTGSVMPEREDSDAEIWTKMMQTSVVVTEGKLGHQNVYDRPSRDGNVLGTLHGQTQCLEVLETRGNGEDAWSLIRAWEHEDGAQVTGWVPSRKLTMAWPNSRYGLLVDKKEQTLTLFEAGHRVAEIPISTGLVAKDDLIRETAAGIFLTEKHEEGFSTGGFRYDYPLRYDGGNMIHRVGWETVNKTEDFTREAALLGQKASHGCVRIPQEATGESGINAYWLWTHLPYHTRVIILDDPEERTAEALQITGKKVTDKAALQQIPLLAEKPEPAHVNSENETEIILTAGGDAVLATRKEWRNQENAFPAYVTKYGWEYPFSGLKELFATDDMTLVNLECVLQDSYEGEKVGKTYRFRGSTQYTEILKAGSIEQVNIANNHYVDFQEIGKRSTRQALQNAGIPYSGYTRLYVWEKDGHKIGFAGVRETIWHQRHSIIAEETKKLRDMGCEVVVYSCHWGNEYETRHNETQTEMILDCAKAGVDIVIGTHPHVVQGMDRVGDTVVLWSLGNLCFGGTLDMTTFDAALARIGLVFDETGYIGANVTMIPVLTSSRAAEGVNDYHPVIAEGEDWVRIMDKILEDPAYDVRGTVFYRKGQ